MRHLLLRKHTLILALCAVATAAQAGDINLTEKYTSNTSFFVENKGQVTDQFGGARNDIDFRLKGNGITLFVGDGQLHYQWSAESTTAKNVISTFVFPAQQQEAGRVNTYRMDMVLLGANKNARVIKEGKQGYTERYYGKQGYPDGIVAGAYDKIIYKDIYPHIDWVLYVDGKDANGLKYDFVVNKGGNAADIKLQYKGATSLTLNDGDMVASTPMGSVSEQAPYTYDAVSKQPIPSRYVLNEGVLSFSVAGNYESFVIDPAIDWATYFGGVNTEFGFSVSTDTAGNAYLAGHTTSGANIATSGAHQTSYNSPDKDGYLAKFDKTGALVWGTYYGGSASDNFFYTCIDVDGNVYAAGITATSSGMATTGAYQASYGGGSSDAYMVKFNTSGARQWATYFGGVDDEAISGSFDYYMVSIAYSAFNNKIYLCGMTSSNSGIATSTSVHQSAIGGGDDGYLACFSTGGAIQWATYYGGGGDDKIVKIAASRINGNIYVAGETNSSSGISAGTVHQGSLGGNKDGFIAAFTSTGSRQWATYYGGSADDAAAGIATDGYDNVYLAGSTTSTGTGVIATAGSYQPGLAGSSGAADAFLVKFDNTGVRQWGTYFGGPAADHTQDIAIDGTGNICFAGTTGSGGIASPGAYQTTFGGNSDAFMAIFSPTGDRNWVSYFGGPNADNAYGISYSKLGDLYIAVNAASSGLATASSYQMTLSGTQDAMLVKFKADTAAYVIPPVTPTTMCAGDSLYVNYGVTNPFLSGNVFHLELSNAWGNFSNAISIGTLTSTAAGRIGGRLPDTLTGGTGYRVRIRATSPAGRGFDNGINLTIKRLPEKPVAGANTPLCNDKDLLLTATSGTSGATYSWTGPSFTSAAQNPVISVPPTTATGSYIVSATFNGCTSKDTVAVVVNQAPAKPTVGGNTPVCTGKNINLTASSSTIGVSYSWTGPNGFTSPMQNPSRTAITMADSGYYVATATLGSCISKDSVLIDADQSGTPVISYNINPGVNICVGDTVTFTATATNAGNTPTFQWYLNNTAVTPAGNSFSSYAITTGDVVFCVLNTTGSCLTRLTDTTAKVTMNSSGNIAPTVTVNALPGTNVPTGTAITFLASHTDGGNNPTFKWYINNVLQPATTGVALIATFGLDIKAGDKVRAIMKSDLSCAEPDTAESNEVQVGSEINVGIGMANNGTNWNIYPNPNTGKFVLAGKTHATELELEIMNAVGQVIYRHSIKPVNGEVKEEMNGTQWPAGSYLLRLKTGEDTHAMRMIIAK